MVNHRSGRRGFTLLELLLSLALMVVVLSVTALSLHATLRATSSGREDVQQAQIARAVLRKIAADVRGAISYEPPDIKSLLPAASGGGGAAAQGAGGATGGAGATNSGGAAAGANAGNTGGGNTSGAAAGGDEGSESDTAPAVESEPTPPGLFGGPNWIEVDVSLPTPPVAYAFGAPQNTALEIDSEFKTVGYWFEDGLYRREIDRSVTLWAVENGAMADLQADLAPLATEVLDLTFEYYDGADWLTEWNSADVGGLPAAVRISIALADPRSPDVLVWHTLTVGLPMGGAASSSSESANESATEEGSSSAGAGDTT